MITKVNRALLQFYRDYIRIIAATVPCRFPCKQALKSYAHIQKAIKYQWSISQSSNRTMFLATTKMLLLLLLSSRKITRRIIKLDKPIRYEIIHHLKEQTTNFHSLIHYIFPLHFTNRRVPHELFLTKGVPQEIRAGLEILRKFVLAWRFQQIEQHLDNFFIL